MEDKSGSWKIYVEKWYPNLSLRSLLLLENSVCVFSTTALWSRYCYVRFINENFETQRLHKVYGRLSGELKQGPLTQIMSCLYHQIAVWKDKQIFQLTAHWLLHSHWHFIPIVKLEMKTCWKYSFYKVISSKTL